MPALSPTTLDLLVAYHWPGNIRELKNVLERLVLQANGGQVEPQHLPPDILKRALAARDDKSSADRAVGSHHARVAAMMERLLTQKESFWTSVYSAFMMRDLTRDDLRFIVRSGLEQTCGSYRLRPESVQYARGRLQAVPRLSETARVPHSVSGVPSSRPGGASTCRQP